MASLFDTPNTAPLAERRRPRRLADYAREPRHTFTSTPETGAAWRGFWQLLLGTGVVWAAGWGWLREQAISPR